MLLNWTALPSSMDFRDLEYLQRQTTARLSLSGICPGAGHVRCCAVCLAGAALSAECEAGENVFAQAALACRLLPQHGPRAFSRAMLNANEFIYSS